MIGVVASAAQHRVVREFFNLFKTPWEFCGLGASYEVLICADSQVAFNPAQLVVVYGARPGAFDAQNGLEAISSSKGAHLSFKGNRIPLYGDCVSLSGRGKTVLQTEKGETVGLEFGPAERRCVRLAFDLFSEVKQLLRRGQPAAHARIPTLDLQIALLRDLIVERSIPLVEIPPVPPGYKFIVCLTHDLDHPGIKNHRCDHTMFGFLFRAIFGSLAGFCKGRRSFQQLAANWRAAISLPLVHLGLAADFWKTIGRYREIEGALPSTFFVIPQQDNPGRGIDGPAPSRRAARYVVEQLRDEIKALVATGCEIGLHGIDAWRDVARGLEEMAAIRTLSDQLEIGVRMHWLYFDEKSPALLEKAGFSYDSTVGYNETVGCRAGTYQAFQPLGVDRLLELPMHIMDTALFFPGRLDLTDEQAREILDEIVGKVIHFGGALTINWHDRSIAPERLWDEPYIALLDELKKKGAWFATCAQAVSWFKQRRSAVIEQSEGAAIRVTIPPNDIGLPGLRLWLHNAQTTGPDSPEAGEAGRFSEVILDGSREVPWPPSGKMATVA